MAEAQIHEVLGASKEKLFKAVTQYEHYPQFVDGCKSVKVDRATPGRTRVTYNISMMKDITYTLDHTEDLVSGLVTWSLVESDAFKRNIGRWEIKEAGPEKSDVQYKVELDFKFMVPGFVLNKLVKGSLPSMLKSFEKRARSL